MCMKQIKRKKNLKNKNGIIKLKDIKKRKIQENLYGISYIDLNKSKDLLCRNAITANINEHNTQKPKKKKYIE